MASPRDFFHLSQNLLDAGWNDQATYRTVINRAYYACHLMARDALFGADGSLLSQQKRKKILGKKRGGDHEVVISAIATHPRVRPGDRKNWSDQLGQLKDARVEADYYFQPGGHKQAALFGRYQVQAWRDLAHQVMALASNVLPGVNSLPRFP